MTDTVCRDCGRTVDLSHIQATCMPRPERIQCSRCWVSWLILAETHRQRMQAGDAGRRGAGGMHTEI